MKPSFGEILESRDRSQPSYEPEFSKSVAADLVTCGRTEKANYTSRLISLIDTEIELSKLDETVRQMVDEQLLPKQDTRTLLVAQVTGLLISEREKNPFVYRVKNGIDAESVCFGVHWMAVDGGVCPGIFMQYKDEREEPHLYIVEGRKLIWFAVANKLSPFQLDTIETLADIKTSSFQ